MRCYKCGREMKNVMHFEDGKEYQFNTCKRCRENTKHKRIHYEELEKGRRRENT